MPSSTLITGGNGQLAREIRKHDPAMYAPDKEEMDFSLPDAIETFCAPLNLRLVIHAGAVTNKFNEEVDEEYIRTNIVGTANVALWALRHDVRLVYISTDYVYPGETGDYSEESPLFPINRYALSKLGGECSVRLVQNSLVVRTSFYRDLNFAKGCVDQFTSRMPIGEVAHAIYRLALRDEVRGVINVGGRARRSLQDIIQSEFNPQVVPILRKDIAISYHIPYDSTLNTTRFSNLMTDPAKGSKKQSSCRICGSSSLFGYLDLGRTPLANSYVSDKDLPVSEFREELAIQVCRSCGLSQLTRVVHPDLMFKKYLYVSSTTDTFREHCGDSQRRRHG